MSDWTLTYEGFDPQAEGLRETLCALGNGHFVSRGAAPNAHADEVHYPGTYLAGGYNRLVSPVAGHEVENEDLVNLPNWLPLTFRIGDGQWMQSDNLEYLSYTQELDLKTGVLSRTLRLRDGADRVTRWEEQRFVSMHDPHLAALSVRLTPENWSGSLTIRTGIDGSVTNWGVPRYRSLQGRHLETLDCASAGDLLSLRSRMVWSRREIALAARTEVRIDSANIQPESNATHGNIAYTDFLIDAREGTAVDIDKFAAIYDTCDVAITEPLHDAVEHARHARDFDALLAHHTRAWAHLWQQVDIRIESTSNNYAQLRLRLHIFHLIQTASNHSVDLDVGIPPRGWHGEAYRGHIMWDELFIFPYLSLRMPVLTRALLRYRYRRLDAARRAARDAGYRGAMFPWMSGSNGREETQRLHLNPKSGRWNPDNTWRQRHIGAAIAYNVWQHVQVTDDTDFLRVYAAELFCEIARFWASTAKSRPDGRYGITGVMGPDEFHTAYPGRDPETDGGLDNNAYTNVMVSWVLARVSDILAMLPAEERQRLCDKLEIDEDELSLWDDISRRLFIPFDEHGIISQFEGYADLKEFDWDGYAKKYGDLQRLDRILESEGQDPNDYKVTKQADTLMIFYLFSREELERIFDQLGYAFTPDTISRNIEYYMQRTSNGSTLSWVAHAWVLARADRQKSWELTLKVLDSDIADIQGGTTSEGIHLGAMAGTVDLIQRCYTGIEVSSGALLFNPRLPDEVSRLEATVRFRQHVLDVEITQQELTVCSRELTAYPITIGYRGQARSMSPGQRFSFRLVPELKRHRVVQEKDRAPASRGHQDAESAQPQPALEVARSAEF